jgi:hypothetical protein
MHVIVGLPDAAVKESRDRVSTALTNSRSEFPVARALPSRRGPKQASNGPYKTSICLDLLTD